MYSVYICSIILYTYFGVGKIRCFILSKKRIKKKIPKTIEKDHYYKNPPGWYNGWNNTTIETNVNNGTKYSGIVQKQ